MDGLSYFVYEVHKVRTAPKLYEKLLKSPVDSYIL